MIDMALSSIRYERFFRDRSRPRASVWSIVFPMQLCLMMQTGHAEGETDIQQIWKLIDVLESFENGPIQTAGVAGGQR